MRNLLAVVVSLALTAAVATTAQIPGDPMGPPDPIPNPLPSRPKPKKEEGDRSKPAWEELYRDSDAPWELPEETNRTLAARAAAYQEFARRFTCTETARSAKYRADEASKEVNRKYSYLLTTEPEIGKFRESRYKINRNGKVQRGEVKDEEKFPPAYAWVFLFSEFNQGFFAYRDLGDYYDGFDWVREIQFKGSFRFTDGKDIRQWEGIALVDAATFTPLEIRAEPIGQRDHIRGLYRRWSTAFNLAGLRFAPRPFGYSCQVDFRLRESGLTFPTQLRYDTFRAVSNLQSIPWKASTRDYTDYRFFNVGTTEDIGDAADETP